MERVKNFIHLYQTENPIKKAFACEYIKKLSGIGLINTKDPRNHFYTDKGKLKMIDFGEVEDISSLTQVQKREKMNEIGVGYNESLIIPPSNDLPNPGSIEKLSLIHNLRFRRLLTCRSRWSPYH